MDDWIQFFTSPPGIATAAFFIVAVFATWWWSRPRQGRLDYEIVESSLIGPTGVEDQPVTVMVGDRTLDEPWVTVLRVTNGGQTPIRPSDFEEEYGIALHWDDAELVSWRQRKTNVGDYKIPFSVERFDWRVENLTIMPLVLNPGQWIEVVLITDGEPDPRITAHIAGVPEIRRVPDRSELYATAWSAFQEALRLALPGFPFWR